MVTEPDRLRKLLDAATPGPWKVMHDRWIAAKNYGVAEFRPLDDAIADCPSPNAALIAALVNAAPLLLDVVDAARHVKRAPGARAYGHIEDTLAALDAHLERGA